MRLLIVAATWMEVKFIADEFEYHENQKSTLKSYSFNHSAIDILVAGIGTTFTAFHLTNILCQKSYDLVLNIGLAGSFTPNLKLGTVVNVVSEEFADLGIEDKTNFLTLFESGFLNADEYPFESGVLKNDFSLPDLDLPMVRGLTSNKSHGKKETISYMFIKFNAHVETMEGAAVFYVCKWMGVPFLEIRSISNFVEPRESSSWDIPKALDSLKSSVLDVLENINVVLA